MEERLNRSKSVIKEQKYEEYWKGTLALTDFTGNQFIKTLQLVIEHIDKYKLYKYSDEELIKNLKVKRKKFNQEIAHADELENQVWKIFPNDSKDGSSTRKQINTMVKLGFIKPYLKGYVPAAKKYIKSNISDEERERLFSDTVYQYSSFNSSQTNDDTNINQIKYIVNTLLNRQVKKLDKDEFIGIMQIDIGTKAYADEKQIRTNKNWADHIEFESRKYNQINHLKIVLSKMNLFKVISKGKGNFSICLSENASEFLPEKGSTIRDNYRFAVMKKAVYDESLRIYGKKISWYSKQESQALVVSHIYASADALKNWQIDEAYDPNNAFLLKPGDEDQYFDKYNMTFDVNGNPMFSNEIRPSFIKESRENGYKIDSVILTTQRLKYLTQYHHSRFKGTLK